MRNKAFTLIEVLVVMTIIGVLASIVLVSFSGQRERAKLTRAQNFDAQISHALGAYAVGIWRFEEGSGTTLHDESGFGNNGILGDGTCTAGNGSCPSWTSGVYTGTNALQFGGTDDYVEIADSSSLDLANAVTVEAWVKQNTLVDWAGIVSKSQGVANINYLLLMHSDGSPYFSVTVSGAEKSTYNGTGTILPIGEWHHLVGTFDGTNLRYYYDGAMEGSITPTGGDLDTNNESVEIGKLISFFNGAIDNVAIYNEALSVGQIQQHYAQGAFSRNIARK